MFLFVALFLSLSMPMESSVDLQGLPLHLEWSDLNADGRLDLTAVIMRTETVGSFTTFYRGGSLRGLYEDATSRSFTLRTWLNTPAGFTECSVQTLQEGFVSCILKDGDLYLWNSKNQLEIMRFFENAWQAIRTITSDTTVFYSGNEFDFLWSVGNRHYWVLPGLEGLTLFHCESEEQLFIPFLEAMSRVGRNNRNAQTLNLLLPSFVDLTEDGYDDLVFSRGDQRWVWHIEGSPPTGVEPLELRFFPKNLDGMLIDLDRDGKQELLSIDMVDSDVEKLKDLKKIKSNIKVYRAGHPNAGHPDAGHPDNGAFLEFSEEPAVDQTLPGFLVPTDEDGFFLSDPFQDINSDGLLDMATFGFKISYLQVVRIATTGKMKINFLLELHIQSPEGHFKTLPGGPFEMSWILDLRKLRMPEFGQLTADFNADGWMDLMTVSEKKLKLIFLTKQGYGSKARQVKFPVPFYDPDQVFGRDLNGDGRSEIILLKITGRNTRLAVLELQK